MFKIIKLELFDQFRCAMDKCPNNCCDEDWLISVDDATYNMYKEIGIIDLDAKISASSPHAIIKKDGKCPFISSEGLCMIHKELGEDYLGTTCKSYPRFVSSYLGDCDLFIETIGLSCPAAAEWIVGLNHVCIIEEQVYYENVNEVGKQAIVMPAEEQMKTLLSFYQNEENFEKSMANSYAFWGKEYTAVKLKYIESKDLFLRNLCICFLFEHLMLESKKDEADYVSVLDKVCEIIVILDKTIGKVLHDRDEIEVSDAILSDCLYKIMRKEDH